jgi:hypothetical protein
MKKSTKKDTVLICFLFNIVLSFLSKTMPTQGVGFLTRKINHRSIGVKGFVKKIPGVRLFGFSFPEQENGCHRKLIERTKNRNHKPDRII